MNCIASSCFDFGAFGICHGQPPIISCERKEKAPGLCVP
jgi:hypothetical protein